MSRKIDVLRDFCLVTEKLAAYPCFGRVLGLDAGTMLQNQDRLMYSAGHLQFEYKIPRHFVNKKIPLSGFLAIFDEMTTYAIVATDRKKRPGMSVSLSAEMMGDVAVMGDSIQINAEVVKSGRVMAFTKAEAIDPTSGQVICKGRHIKYLPMPWLTELALGPLMPLLKWFVSYFYAAKKTTTQSGVPRLLEDVLKFEETSANQQSARFLVEPNHCNPMGAAHGGCQAMGMEVLGQNYAAKSSSNSHVLKSMSVSYMSTGKKELTFDANWIHQTEYSGSMSVQVASSSGKPVSEGVLHFIIDHSAKKKCE